LKKIFLIYIDLELNNFARLRFPIFIAHESYNLGLKYRILK
jgi:hypothetical protein